MPAAHGATTAATTRLTASTRAADGSSSATKQTVPAPATAAVVYGSTTRSQRSAMPSTSATSRLTRSPERNAGSPAGASRSRRRYAVTRIVASTRSAAS